MDFATAALLLFPAFLIGAAFGAIVNLVLAGDAGFSNKRPLFLSAAGSLAGVVIFLFTQNWWPPIVGPFILSPALALVAALAGRTIFK